MNTLSLKMFSQNLLTILRTKNLKLKFLVYIDSIDSNPNYLVLVAFRNP